MPTSCVDVVCNQCQSQYATTYDKKTDTASTTLFKAGWKFVDAGVYKKWLCPDCVERMAKKGVELHDV